MSEHTATLAWTRGDAAFTYETYSRDHRLVFENGLETLASSAPAYAGNPKALNPETLLVGALASCHMLTFLHLAAQAGLVVDRYEDHAEGVMEKTDHGRFWVSRVTLRPRILWGQDPAPAAAEILRLHHAAHDECFIANSVRTEVVCIPVP